MVGALTYGRTDGQTDTQNFRGYNIIPRHFFGAGHKNSGSFHISAQNTDCGYSLEPPRQGGSNEYPQSMFLSRNKKINVYPCKPQFYCIKVGFKGGQNISVFS